MPGEQTKTRGRGYITIKGIMSLDTYHDRADPTTATGELVTLINYIPVPMGLVVRAGVTEFSFVAA